ncbi:DUF2892 family protein [Alteromonas sp. 76-1]|jgi:hypothetical protein|uniref:YgaP family membrane protein n=1 Tax=Alteromonas TaxID=226 RepID=UPI000FD18458|nr:MULTISPECIES: DUF2892 domain-containing protein [Alteromonas]MCQ8848011.1 DUF2892 domain-containing protein [Alteromonas stellipolaris]VEL95231.1 DUF2892 family protein [Alteromonas sp. 76-1]
MAIHANLSLLDRTLRGAIGISVTAFAFLNGNIIDDVFIEILLGIFGVLNLISLLSGWCPVYQIAGVSTKES